MVPAARIRYSAEGKAVPQSYMNHYRAISSPLYRLSASQDFSRDGYWGLTLWYTGTFGGGSYGTERVSDDRTGATYQTNQLNVGFTNLFVTYHHPLGGWPVEAQASVSVVREIFTRRHFSFPQANVESSVEDVNEISAEGIGFGLQGLHGDRCYLRWQTAAHAYIQVFDAETDAFAGHIFQAEAGLGVRLWKGLTLEGGGLWQYWFISSKGNRRLQVEGTDGAVISWNRQETRVGGLYVQLAYRPKLR